MVGVDAGSALVFPRLERNGGLWLTDIMRVMGLDHDGGKISEIGESGRDRGGGIGDWGKLGGMDGSDKRLEGGSRKMMELVLGLIVVAGG